MKTDYIARENYLSLIEEKNDELWDAYFKLKKICRNLSDHESVNKNLTRLIFSKLSELDNYYSNLSFREKEKANEIIDTWNGLLENINL